MLEALNDRRMSADPFLMQYHLSPAYGWMNDPNGIIYYQGAYHVFYQFDPNQPTWNLMHWGHFRSVDLVHWEELPIALYPDQTYDADGCFSGSAVVDGDELVLIYTGHRWLDDQREQFKQVQCIARSNDGIHFVKDPANPVIENLPIPSSIHLRDPKVWKDGETWWMVLGNQVEFDQQNIGRLAFFQSTDLKEWTFVSVAKDRLKRFGYMWECPDYFRLDGKDIVVLSPQGIERYGDRFRNRFQTGYFQGLWKKDTAEFSIDDFEELDAGHDFYAAQTTIAPDGRRLLWAWMDMWENPNITAAQGWAGALTIPRELFWSENGKLSMLPARELLNLRDSRLFKWHDLNVYQLKKRPLRAREVNYEFVATLQGSDLKRNTLVHGPPTWSIWFRASADGQERTELKLTILEADQEHERMTHVLVELDRSKAGGWESGQATLDQKGPFTLRRALTTLPQDGLIRIRAFVDRSSIELFINDGQLSFSSRIFPSLESDHVFVNCSDESALIHAISIYPLKSVITRAVAREVDR